jgi:hypothetical protein
MDCKSIESSFKDHDMESPKTGEVKFSFFGNNNTYFRVFITKLQDNENFLEINKKTTVNQLVTY